MWDGNGEFLCVSNKCGLEIIRRGREDADRLSLIIRSIIQRPPRFPRDNERGLGSIEVQVGKVGESVLLGPLEERQLVERDRVGSVALWGSDKACRRNGASESLEVRASVRWPENVLHSSVPGSVEVGAVVEEPSVRKIERSI